LAHAEKVGLVCSPRSSWLRRNDSRWIHPGGARRMGGSAHFKSVAVHRVHAEVAGCRYWSHPYCADADTSTAYLPNRHKGNSENVNGDVRSLMWIVAVPELRSATISVKVK
jgi:hypothetical protein